MVNPKKQHFTCSKQWDMSRQPCSACLDETPQIFRPCFWPGHAHMIGLAEAQAPARAPQHAEDKACATDQACACADLPVAGSSLG